MSWFFGDFIQAQNPREPQWLEGMIFWGQWLEWKRDDLMICWSDVSSIPWLIWMEKVFHHMILLMSSCGKILRASLKILMLFVWLLKPNLKFWIGFHPRKNDIDMWRRWTSHRQKIQMVQLNQLLTFTLKYSSTNMNFFDFSVEPEASLKVPSRKVSPWAKKQTPFGRPHGKSWFRKNKSRFKLDTQKTKGVFWKESDFQCFFWFRWICFSFLISGLIT